LWKNGISHNDFAAQNIMIKLIQGDVKLIDFGLATLHKQIYPELDDNIESLYTEYYNKFSPETLLENEGTNVKKLGEFITEYKSRKIEQSN
jgi:serine/threonine protein kinase